MEKSLRQNQPGGDIAGDVTFAERSVRRRH
jgi:hypothetical protein